MKQPRHFSSTKDELILQALGTNTNPLIKVSWLDVTYANTISEKKELIKDFENTTFILPWWWKWNTDVFELTQEDIVLLANA